jgi:hypothetical protein
MILSGMAFTRRDKVGFIFCGVGLMITFLLAAYIDRWTEAMLRDGAIAVCGWMFTVLGLRIRPERD